MRGPAELDEDTVYLTFSGDLGFDETWSPDPAVIDAHVAADAPLLARFDYRIVNLEFQLPGLTGRPTATAVDETTLGILRRLRFDAVSVANNHSWDLGRPGLEHSVRRVVENGIEVFGLREAPSLSLDLRGERIDVFTGSEYFVVPAPDAGVLTLERDDLEASTAGLDDGVFRIAYVHLGSISSYPSPHELSRVESLVDAGADLVVCTGNHFVRGFAEVRDTPIVWALGNHLFFYEGPNTEFVGMHLVAGVRGGALRQLIAVPFRNRIRAGEVGPLDADDFARFVATFEDRSTADPARYFADPRSWDAIGYNLSWRNIPRIRPRHLVYGTRIAFERFPLAASAVALAGVATIAGGARWWHRRSTRRRPAGEPA